MARCTLLLWIASEVFNMRSPGISQWTEGEGEDAKPFEASTPEFSVGAYVDTKELRSDDSPLEISPFSIQTHIDDLGD